MHLHLSPVPHCRCCRVSGFHLSTLGAMLVVVAIHLVYLNVSRVLKKAEEMEHTWELETCCVLSQCCC